MVSRFILRLISELLNNSPLFFFHLFVASTSLWAISPSPISSFSHLRSLELFNIRGSENTIVGPLLATLSSQVSRIVLHTGRMSADILKKSIVHFKELRSLELLDAVLISDFALWEVLGTLPSLANLTLTISDPASHPAPENSKSRSRRVKYFDALESLSVTGSFFLSHRTSPRFHRLFMLKIN